MKRRFLLTLAAMQVSCVATVIQTLPRATFEQAPHTSGLRVRLDAVYVDNGDTLEPDIVYRAGDKMRVSVRASPTPATWMQDAVLQQLAAAGIDTTDDCEAPGLTVGVRDFRAYSVEEGAPSARIKLVRTAAAPRVEATLFYPATKRSYFRAFEYREEVAGDHFNALSEVTAQLAHDTHMALAAMSASVLAHLSGVEPLETAPYTIVPQPAPEKAWLIRGSLTPRWVIRSLDVGMDKNEPAGDPTNYDIPDGFSIPLEIEGRYDDVRLAASYYSDLTTVKTGPSQGFGATLQYRIDKTFSVGGSYNYDLWRGTFLDANNGRSAASVLQHRARLWVDWGRFVRLGFFYIHYPINQPLFLADGAGRYGVGPVVKANIDQYAVFTRLALPLTMPDSVVFYSGVDASCEAGIGGASLSWPMLNFAGHATDGGSDIVIHVAAAAGWQVLWRSTAVEWHLRAGMEVNFDAVGDTMPRYAPSASTIVAPSSFIAAAPYITLSVHD